jgi:glycosyltransferase involved in cell wall biosynthesis
MEHREQQTQRVRIAYIVPSLLEGGAQQHVALLCSHIDRDRYDPVVFCLYQQGPFADTIRQAEVPVTTLLGAKLLSLWWRLMGRNTSSSARQPWHSNCGQSPSFRKILGSVGKTMAEIISCFNLAFQLRARDIDLVSVHWSKSKIALAAAWLAGVPSIYTEHSTVHIYYDPTEIRILRRLVPLAERVIAVSESARRSAIDYLDIPDSRIDVIGHAVQFGIPAEVHIIPEEDVPPTIAVLGSLAEHKGHVYFLQAARMLLQTHSDVRFLIAGDGPLRSSLERTASELGLDGRIRFIGAYDNDDVPDILQDVSVVTVPSITEALGIVALEAMACGKPVVASAVGGLPEIVRDGETGLLVSPKDPAALAEAIARLLDDSDLRRELGWTGREFACQQTPEQITGQTMAVYKRVLCS